MSKRGVHIEIQYLSHRDTAKRLITADVAIALPGLALEPTGLRRARAETCHDTMVTG